MEYPLRTVSRQKVENRRACVAAAVGVRVRVQIIIIIIMIIITRGNQKRVGNPSRISVGFGEVAAFGVGFEV